MSLRLGELCAGYNGLGMAVEEVFGATSAWFSEFDAAPSKILAHHYPNVPNYGDMTAIDWANIEHADIISGGTPCQDLSAAGRRKGMTEGTRSNLWVQMREAIAIQRPKYVVWENVRGAYSAKADSDLEQCPGCMGDAGNGGTVLRALGRVLGDLSDLGYDSQWRGLRAADVGACHGRFRVFVLAVRRPGFLTAENADDRRGPKSHHGHQRRGEARQWAPALLDASDSRPGLAEDPNIAIGSERRQPAPGQAESGRAWADAGGRGGALVTPGEAATNTLRGRSGRRTTQSGAGRCHYAVIGSGTRGSWARVAATNTHRGDDAGRKQDQERGPKRGAATQRPSGSRIEWGPYAPAIRRWEALRGTAPSPTELTAKGNYRLSARFAEWMMGLPEGWVTDPAIGINRNAQLKALGNGVVPQQAIAALRDMLAAFETEKAA